MTTVYSQNGYVANDRSLVSKVRIPGTEVDVTVANSAAGSLLIDFASKFDKAVEDIDNARGHLDDWGFAERPIRGSTTELSNHASGTAIDLNATKHPLSKRGTFSPTREANIHALLAMYDGCIRWGGDYERRADEMHFEIVRPLAECERVLNDLHKEDDMALSDDDIKRVGDYIMKRFGVDDPNHESARSLSGTLTELQRDVNRILEKLGIPDPE